MNNVVLIKVGEIWLKGKNRDDFVNRLVFNIKEATGADKKEIEIGQGRIYVRNLQPASHNALKYVFGLHSFVEAQKTPLDLEEAKNVSREIAKQEIAGGAKTFKVNASRADKSFPQNSMQINSDLGAEILDKLGEDISVDVNKPDFVLNVEVRKGGIYIYSSNKEVEGPGGLPVGVSGKGLLMMSGGIDSPVAGWMAMKRGMRLYAVHFASPPYTGEKAKEKVMDLCRALAPYNASKIKLFVVPFTKIQVETTKTAPKNLWTLLHRRYMVKISREIAEKEGYDTLISGESLGQVASQTVENMRSVSYDINFPILRPLVGFDKQETVDLAKKIETYKTSILPYEDCCTVFSADNPKTKAKPDEVAKSEEGFDSEKLIKEALENTETYDID